MMTQYTKKPRRPKSKYILIIAAIVIGITAIVLATLNTESGKRFFKNVSSNWTGGLQRIVYVYDNNGNLLRTYEGEIDIQENDFGNKVLFDLYGKRYVLYNATVIVEEQ